MRNESWPQTRDDDVTLITSLVRDNAELHTTILFRNFTAVLPRLKCAPSRQLYSNAPATILPAGLKH